MAPKTREPVEVRFRPTSRKTLKGLGSSSPSRGSVSVMVPSASVTPSYLSAKLRMVRARRATKRPVA